MTQGALNAAAAARGGDAMAAERLVQVAELEAEQEALMSEIRGIELQADYLAVEHSLSPRDSCVESVVSRNR